MSTTYTARVTREHPTGNARKSYWSRKDRDPYFLLFLLIGKTPIAKRIVIPDTRTRVPVQNAPPSISFIILSGRKKNKNIQKATKIIANCFLNNLEKFINLDFIYHPLYTATKTKTPPTFLQKGSKVLIRHQTTSQKKWCEPIMAQGVFPIAHLGIFFTFLGL